MTLQNTVVLVFKIFLFAIAGISILTAIAISIILISVTARRFGVAIKLVGRPRKIDAKNETLSILFSGTLGLVTFLTAGFVLNGFFDLKITLSYFSVSGLSIGFAAGFLRHLTGGKPIFHTSARVTMHKRQFNSMSPWVITDRPDGSKLAKWYDRRDKLQDEFIFIGTDNYWLPTKVPESMMYRFCKVALYRHHIAMDPERTTYKRTGRKLRSHEILSEQFFCNSRGFVPRLLPEQFESIWYILAYTGHWLDRRPGHCGNLIVDWMITPERMVRVVRWGWLTLTLPELENKGLRWRL